MKANKSTLEKLEEFYYCRENCEYFIENYIELELPGENVLFKMYEPQKVFLQSLLDDHYAISLKSRQIGISTVVQAWIVHTMLFHKNVVVGVVSRDGAESTDFCRKVMSMIKNLPEWLQPTFDKESEQTFILDNKSKFYAGAVSLQNPAKLFRGKAVTIAIIDEAAFIDKIDEGFTGFAPSLVKAQTVAKRNNVPYGTVLISTPNKTTGIGRWFYEKWAQATTDDDSLYVPHLLHWKQIAEFRDDPDWYKTQCRLLHNDQIKIQQELECKFLASSNSFFSPETVEKLNDCKLPPTSKLHIKGNDLWLWESPNSSRYYLVCIDVASASGGDKSAIEIMDYVTFEQVGEYVGKMRVDDFCDVVTTINKIFPRNLIVVECNSYGNQVVEYLTKTRASFNVYQQKMKNANASQSSARYRYGISTNAQSRPLIIDSLYTYVTENPAMIKSQRLSLELIGLETKGNGKVEAGSGMNDDMAMALGFGAYVRMYDPPLSVSTAESNEVVDDLVDIIDMNFSSSIHSSDVTTLKYSDSMNQDRTNRALNRHIKKNLFEMTREGSTIDINKILGFDVQRSDTYDSTGNL